LTVALHCDVALIFTVEGVQADATESTVEDGEELDTPPPLPPQAIDMMENKVAANACR
jgi:hypothetical protein